MENNYKMPSRVEIIALRQRGAERQTAPWLPEEKTELADIIISPWTDILRHFENFFDYF